MVDVYTCNFCHFHIAFTPAPTLAQRDLQMKALNADMEDHMKRLHPEEWEKAVAIHNEIFQEITS